MKNISFMLTTDQIKNRTKTVTRRVGWLTAKPGDLLQGVVKGMGLKAGEKVEKLAVIRVVSVRREKLRAMLDDAVYGSREAASEGFGDHPRLCWPASFIKFFCESHDHCTSETEVTRIEFEYVEECQQGVIAL